MRNDFIINAPLLDENGLLKEEFISTHEIKKYDRSMVKYNKLNIKESDIYLFEDDKYFLLIILSDYSIYSYLEIFLYDKKNHSSWHKRYQELLTFGSISLPSSIKEGNTYHHHKNFDIEIENNNDIKRMKIHVNSLSINAHFNAEFNIANSGKSLVFVKGSTTKKEFIYKADTTCLSASGTFIFGPLKHTFNKAKASYIFKRGNEKKLKGINIFSQYKDKVIDINLVNNVLINVPNSELYYSLDNFTFNKDEGSYNFTFDSGSLTATPIIKESKRNNVILAKIQATLKTKKGESLKIEELGFIFLL